MPRSLLHARETNSRDWFRSKIDSFFENGDALFREWSERDYGIDAVVEIFDNGYPTGKIAFIQLKGTSKTIQALKKGDQKGKAVSCGNVSNSSLDYARQDKIPMILVYVSLAEPQCFSFVDLQSQIDDIESRRKKEGQKEHTVHIPIDNYAEDDLSGFFELIDSYYAVCPDRREKSVKSESKCD